MTTRALGLGSSLRPRDSEASLEAPSSEKRKRLAVSVCCIIIIIIIIFVRVPSCRYGLISTRIGRSTISRMDTLVVVVPGDEVIEWNGRSLQGKSFREVYDVIAESREEPQIELVVERKLSTGVLPAGPGPSTPMASRRIVAQSQWRQRHETISGPQQPHHKGDYAAGPSDLRPRFDSDLAT